MRLNFWINILLLIFLLFAFIVTGCQETTFEDAHHDKVNISYSVEIMDVESIWPDHALKKRFLAYWHKQFAGDIDCIWNMEAPHFQFMANKAQYDNYHAMTAAKLPIDIEIQNVKMIGEYFYLINFRLSFTRGSQTRTVDTTDHWVYVQGKWYHVLRDPFAFPFTG